MILTLTIDTHPHTNALIEGQVKRAVEDLLRARRLGVVVSSKADAVDLEYLTGLLREALVLSADGDVLTEGPAHDKLQEALEYLKGF